MRILLGITVVAILVVAAWASIPTVAKQKYDAVSIDPLAMTGTVNNLPPEVHYDHGFVFPEQQ